MPCSSASPSPTSHIATRRKATARDRLGTPHGFLGPEPQRWGHRDRRAKHLVSAWANKRGLASIPAWRKRSTRLSATPALAARRRVLGSRRRRAEMGG